MCTIVSCYYHFISSSCRYRLCSSIALNVLDCFIKHLYMDDDSEKVVCIGDIYEMIWSHSQFLDIMLSSNETNDSIKGKENKLIYSNI